MNLNEQTWRTNRTWVIWLLDVVGFVVLAGIGLTAPEAWGWPGWTIPLTLVPLTAFLAWRVPLTFDQFRGALVVLAVAAIMAMIVESLDTPWKELAWIGLVFLGRNIFQRQRATERVSSGGPAAPSEHPAHAPDEVAAD